MRIITNNQYRPILYYWELSEQQQDFVKSEYDYGDPEDMIFFVYKGRVENMDNFMRLDGRSPFPEFWHGYDSDTFFSGLLIHVSDCGDALIVGLYLS